jgi:hypothetical protein
LYTIGNLGDHFTHAVDIDLISRVEVEAKKASGQRPFDIQKWKSLPATSTTKTFPFFSWDLKNLPAASPVQHRVLPKERHDISVTSLTPNKVSKICGVICFCGKLVISSEKKYEPQNIRARDDSHSNCIPPGEARIHSPYLIKMKGKNLFEELLLVLSCSHYPDTFVPHYPIQPSQLQAHPTFHSLHKVQTQIS